MCEHLSTNEYGLTDAHKRDSIIKKGIKMVDIDTLYQLDGGWTLNILRAVFGDMFSPFHMDPYQPIYWYENPINRVLKNDHLWETFKSKVNGSLSAVALVRAQVICQQAMWQGRGPEGDRLPKTLRKLWYAGHKEALQQISRRLEVWRNESGQMNDVAANGCMSQVYGDFVDSRLVTYLDMYVKDGSRQFEVIDGYYRLPQPYSNLVMCIEKDAAYEDCVRIGRALGVAAAVSGGGKMGKAGTENMVRQALSSRYDISEPGDLVTEENHCYVLVISDWDYDGESVIAPTFVQQLRRYVPDEYLHWVRVGIRPEQVEQMGYSPESKAYQVKYHVNSAYTSWCRDKALFEVYGQIYNGLDDAVIDHAGYLSPILGYQLQNRNGDPLKHDTLKKIYELVPPLGFELDALKRVEYASLVVEGLLQMISWDDLLEALSKKAWANPDSVSRRLTEEVLDNNDDYIDLTSHIEELERKFAELMANLHQKREDFEAHAREAVEPLVQSWLDDERVKDNDQEPEQEDLAGHLRLLNPYDHWQPYQQYRRNDALVSVVRDEEQDTLNELMAETIEFDRITL
jgi:hypothetical protein